MPFVATTGHRIPLFQNVLEAPISLHPAANGSEHQPNPDVSSLSRDMAAEAYQLFVENRFRVEFDRQPNDTIDAIARSELMSRPEYDVDIDKASVGYVILDHLKRSLVAQLGRGESEQVNTQASTLAAALASSVMWNAETEAMSKTFADEGLNLPPGSANVGIRVRLNDDGTGWVVHKTALWHSYIDGSGKERRMDNGSPILRVDNQIEVRFDWHSDSDFKLTASPRFCHVGWSDPLLDARLLFAHEEEKSADAPGMGAPPKHVPLERKGLRGFFSRLYNIMAYCLGAKGIQYKALEIKTVSQIINDGSTMHLKQTVGGAGVDPTQIHHVKHDPMNERHYAAAYPHSTDIEAFHFSRTTSAAGAVWTMADGVALPGIEELLRERPNLLAQEPPPPPLAENVHQPAADPIDIADQPEVGDIIEEAAEEEEEDDDEDNGGRYPAALVATYKNNADNANNAAAPERHRRASDVLAERIVKGEPAVPSILIEPAPLHTPSLTDEEKASLKGPFGLPRQPTNVF